jgi:hypothetical protein
MEEGVYGHIKRAEIQYRIFENGWMSLWSVVQRQVGGRVVEESGLAKLSLSVGLRLVRGLV